MDRTISVSILYGFFAQRLSNTEAFSKLDSQTEQIENLGDKVIKGASWTITSKIVAQLLSFCVTIVLVRLLSPEDYGLVALSGVFIKFIDIFRNMGFGEAIIQRKSINNDFLSTAFWITIAVGLCMVLLIYITSPIICNFYSEKGLRNILILSSLAFLISPLSEIHETILTKNLEFKKIAYLNLLYPLFFGASAILLALSDFGVWSLVLGNLIAQFLITPVIWSMAKWRPKFVFNMKRFKELLDFGSYILSFKFVNYLARNSDNLIIGKVLGAISLGYYSIAYNLMLKPLQHISWSISRIMLPTLSSIQEEKERVRTGYLKTVRSISLITFPIMTGLMVVAREFVLIFYGIKWEPAVIPLRILCIVGALQSIGTTVGTIFISQGRPDLQLRVGVFNTSIIVAAFFIGVKWGLTGVALAYGIVSIILFLPNQYWANRLIGLKLRYFLKALYPAAFSSFIMMTILHILREINVVFFHLHTIPLFISLCILGFLVYLILAVHVFCIPEIEEIVLVFEKKFFHGRNLISKFLRKNCGSSDF